MKGMRAPGRGAELEEPMVGGRRAWRRTMASTEEQRQDAVKMGKSEGVLPHLSTRFPLK